jgi:hypothetical protein
MSPRSAAIASAAREVGDLEIDVTSDTAQLAVLPYYRLVEWQYGVSALGRRE